MKVSAVHFNPKISPHLQHNDRTNSNSKNIIKDLSHLNECDKKASEVLREIDKLHKEAMNKLKGKKGKRTPKERSFHEAIFEINADTTMEKCRDLTNAIAELTGFTPLQISIHRDEGYTNEKGEFVTHHHAHAVFFTLDKKTGKQLARQEASLTKWNLSKMQDMASEILGMQRGEERLKKGKKKYYIQDYKEYKAVQETLQERGEFINDLADEVKEGFKTLEQRLNSLESKEKDLERRERSLDKREAEIEKKQSDLNESIARNQALLLEAKRKKELAEKKIAENKALEAKLKALRSKQEEENQETFQKLREDFESKHNFFINALSFGFFHSYLKKNYESQKTQIHQTIEIKDRKQKAEIEALRSKIDHLENTLSKAQQTVREQETKIKFLNDECVRLVKAYEPYRIQQDQTHTRTPKQHTQSHSRGR